MVKLGHARTSGDTVGVPVTCSGESSCSVTLSLSATETMRDGRVRSASARKPKRGTRTVELGTAKLTLGADQSRTVKVAVNRVGRALLSKLRSFEAKLSAAGMSAGRKSSASKTVTLRAAKKGKRGRKQRRSPHRLTPTIGPRPTPDRPTPPAGRDDASA